MAPRKKKLIGVAAFLPALMVYFFAAAALGKQVPDHPAMKAVYYLFAGIAWAYPAKFLIAWMEKDSQTPVNKPDQD